MVTSRIRCIVAAGRTIEGFGLRGTAWVAAVAMAATAVAGCGGSPHRMPPSAPVTVIVTNGGVPVTEGQVNLVNTDTGQGGGGTLDTEGRATMAAVPLGEYTVTVIPLSDESSPTAVPAQPAKKPRKGAKIPSQVQRSDKSPLRMKVERGKSEARFDLGEVR